MAYAVYALHAAWCWPESVIAARLGIHGWPGFLLYLVPVVAVAVLATFLYDRPVRAWLSRRREGWRPAFEPGVLIG